MIVDALKVAVGFVVNLLAKVLVCFRPHLRKISWKKRGYHGDLSGFTLAFVHVESVELLKHCGY